MATKTIDVRHETNPSISTFMARNGKIEVGAFAFDSAYALGGESISFGFTPQFMQIEPTGGYTFEYDHTNGKVKAFVPGKSVIVEEVVTCSSNVGTLKHKPFYIMAVDVTATTTTGPYNVIPVGETPLTKQVAVNFATGGLTFLSDDAVTSVRVTYIPLHETGPFSAGNLVIDEEITASASKTALTHRAAMVQYVWDDTDGVIDALEPVGEAPSATHTAVIDITNATPATDIDFHADDAANTIKVTYIKYSAFQAFQNRGDADLTLASEIYNFNTNLFSFMAIPGLGTQLVGEATATNVQLTWSGPSISVAAGLPVLNPLNNLWSTDESTAVTTLAMPIVYLHALFQEGAKMEVDVGADLSSLAPKYLAVGW
jgi:hypothetical protein